MQYTDVAPGRRQPRLSIPTTTRSIMLDLVVALVPSLAMATYFFGGRVLALAAVSILSCLIFEFGYRVLTGKGTGIADLSACVTGLLLAMCLPPTAPYWAPVLGAFFAIVVVKQFYGGLGHNFMNPALAGRMLLCTFPMLMTTWSEAMDRLPILGAVDAVTAATPMSYLHNGQLPPLSFGQLLLGQHGGSIGEVSAFMLLLGGGYLLMRRVISLRIPLSFLGTVAFLTLISPRAGTPLEWMTAQLLSGGLLLGAIFMATDYVTSPTTPTGQLLFGVGCGVLTVLLRYYGAYPDGVGWAILTMNCVVWLLDRLGMPRRFGAPRLEPTRRLLARLNAEMSQIRFQKPHLPRALSKGLMPGEEHLDELRGHLRSALTLGGVIAATVAMIFCVYLLTDLDTRQTQEKMNYALLQQVMPEAEMVTEAPYRSPNALSISAGYRGSDLLGYCVQVQVPGFGGPLTAVVGVDVDGKVTGVAITSHSETLDMGTQALENGYLDRFIGRSGTVRNSGPNAVDAVSGATVTSKAVTAAVNKALAVVNSMQLEGAVDYVDGEV